MYFDGSDHHLLLSGATEGAFRLGSIVASEQTWADLQTDWSLMLQKHGFDTLHMRKIMHHDGVYGKSWDEVRPVVAEAVNLVLKRYGHMVCFVQEIDLAIYRRAKALCPDLKAPEALCVDYCAGQLAILTKGDFGKRNVVTMVFDRDEPYLKHIRKVWDQSRRASGWPSQVKDIRSGSSSQEVGLQAVDLMVGLCKYRGLEKVRYIADMLRAFSVIRFSDFESENDLIQSLTKRKG